jgi:Flp pilus assembly protein TadG
MILRLVKGADVEDWLMVALTQVISCRTEAGFRRLLRRISANQRGSISIITAVSLPALLGFGGLAVDASLWLRAKNSVQGAADVAASSVAAAASAGNVPARILAEARGVAAANGYQNGANGVTVTLNHPPTSGTYAGNTNAYEVIISAPQQLYLASVFPALTAPVVTGTAVTLTTTSPTCMMALSQNNDPNGTLTVGGGAVFTANKCAIVDDSPSAKSINVGGGGSITAQNISTVGNYSGNITATSGSVQTAAPYVADPYATTRSIPSGPWRVSTQSNTWTGTINNPTGVIAFNGDVKVSGSATLQPGVYIINNGGMSLNNNSSLSGTGVTIIITSSTNPAADNGTFNFGGSGTVILTAPTTGTTAGIALWADGRLPNNSDNLTGSSAPKITGAIYAPSHNVKYAGNSLSATSGCEQLIAYTIQVNGTTTFDHSCDGVGTLDPLGTKWSLVE